MIHNLLLKFAARLAVKGRKLDLQNSNDKLHIERYCMLWKDEYLHAQSLERDGGHPWWFPFNAFLHRWTRSDTGMPHTHPRWTMTIVLAGELWEVIDRKRLRILRPGSVVFRSHKAAHSILVPARHLGRTWTIFIVGRRRHAQEYLLPDGSRISAPVHSARGHKAFIDTGFGAESSLPMLDVERCEKTERTIVGYMHAIEDQLAEEESQNLQQPRGSN